MTVQTKKISKDISNIFWREGYTLATAESCTAGNIAAVITAVAGSSRFFKGGIVAYSEEIKTNLLHVSKETIDTNGVVSEETVKEMAKGAMEVMGADFAVATTGIAGPSGGSSENPVGTIWVAAGCGDTFLTEKLTEDNGRELNIHAATTKALQLLVELSLNQENEAKK